MMMMVMVMNCHRSCSGGRGLLPGGWRLKRLMICLIGWLLATIGIQISILLNVYVYLINEKCKALQGFLVAIKNFMWRKNFGSNSFLWQLCKLTWVWQVAVFLRNFTGACEKNKVVRIDAQISSSLSNQSKNKVVRIDVFECLSLSNQWKIRALYFLHCGYIYLYLISENYELYALYIVAISISV